MPSFLQVLSSFSLIEPRPSCALCGCHSPSRRCRDVPFGSRCNRNTLSATRVSLSPSCLLRKTNLAPRIGLHLSSSVLPRLCVCPSAFQFPENCESRVYVPQLVYQT